MSEQFTDVTVGFAPEVETVTPQWVVAEEYEKLQARIEELETELARVNHVRQVEHVRMDFLEYTSGHLSAGFRAAVGQCTPSRNTTTGLRRLAEWFKPLG